MYLSSIYPQFFRAEKSHAFRQNFVFDGQHARGQRLRRVALQHGHALLHDDPAVIDLLRLRGRRVFNELTHADLIHKVKSDVSVVRNVTVTTPTEDLFLATDKVILPGTITVSVEGV